MKKRQAWGVSACVFLAIVVLPFQVHLLILHGLGIYNLVVSWKLVYEKKKKIN